MRKTFSSMLVVALAALALTVTIAAQEKAKGKAKKARSITVKMTGGAEVPSLWMRPKAKFATPSRWPRFRPPQRHIFTKAQPARLGRPKSCSMRLLPMAWRKAARLRMPHSLRP